MASSSYVPKLIVWDFDLTILRIHSCGERLKLGDVPNRNIERDVADLSFFRAFIRACGLHRPPVFFSVEFGAKRNSSTF